MILPSTYEVSGKLSSTSTHPVAYGGFCDAYSGSLGLENVCIKRLRICVTGDRALVKQVFHPCYLRLGYHILTGSGVILQGSCGVETPRSPKYCAVQGRHLRAPPTRVRMDIWWRIEAIHKGKSWRKLNQPCEFVTTHCRPTLYPAFSCSALPRVSVIFTHAA